MYPQNPFLPLTCEEENCLDSDFFRVVYITSLVLLNLASSAVLLPDMTHCRGGDDWCHGHKPVFNLLKVIHGGVWFCVCVCGRERVKGRERDFLILSVIGD